jgi:hypothetical protein
MVVKITNKPALVEGVKLPLLCARILSDGFGKVSAGQINAHRVGITFTDEKHAPNNFTRIFQTVPANQRLAKFANVSGVLICHGARIVLNPQQLD